MSAFDDLSIRMKTNYENIPKTKLMRRCPVAIRIDGKAFHSFTRGFARPFDDVLIQSMQDTMKYLCENIQGCVAGYHQSDEITLVLVDYRTFDSQAWFDYEVQKMTSISASMATMYFNRAFEYHVKDFLDKHCVAGASIDEKILFDTPENQKLYEAYQKALSKGAMFDSRVFSIPREEVTNMIYWRQVDASRNSVQMVGQTYFSRKELHGVPNKLIQDMLITRKDVNWNDYPTHKKRGSCCIKTQVEVNGAIRSRWIVDLDIPIFRGEDRQYIEKLINFEESEGNS